MNTFWLLVLVVILLVVSFGMPFWIMWTVKELFNVDWSTKYWAVWSMWAILGLMLRADVTKNKE